MAIDDVYLLGGITEGKLTDLTMWWPFLTLRPTSWSCLGLKAEISPELWQPNRSKSLLLEDVLHWLKEHTDEIYVLQSVYPDSKPALTFDAVVLNLGSGAAYKDFVGIVLDNSEFKPLSQIKKSFQSAQTWKIILGERVVGDIHGSNPSVAWG